MLRRFLRGLIFGTAAAACVAAAFIGGFALSRQLYPPLLPPDGGAPADWKTTFPVYWEAWNYVHRDYYKPSIDDTALVSGSIGGMTRALGDPHTGFTEAKYAEIAASSLSGSFEGIGATVEMRDNRLRIVAPIKDSPAERAGLKPDDVIVQVNDKVIQNMTVNDAVALIRGPKGTAVTLKIQRGTQPPFSVDVIRDVIRTPFVESRTIEGTTIAYVRLNQFGAPAADELQASLRTLLAQKPTGLILDLRGNPGGYLNTAVDVASQFLNPGQTVIIERDKQGVAQQLRVRASGLATNIPMVVLIDKGSASASEILAAALKDYKRATLIGVNTYGKGSVQNIHTLSDRSELRVTIAHFFSPQDHEINGVGVAPDIEVKISDEDISAKRDPQLDRAVDLLKMQGTQSKALPFDLSGWLELFGTFHAGAEPQHVGG